MGPSLNRLLPCLFVVNLGTHGFPDRFSWASLFVSTLLESKASTSLKFCYPSAVFLVFLLGVAHGPYLVSSLNVRVLGSFLILILGEGEERITFSIKFSFGGMW